MKTQVLCCLSLICIVQTANAQWWHPLQLGLNYDVYAMAVYGDDVYVGGYFSNAGGNPDADYLARWDGCNWHAVAPGLTGAVYSIAILGEHVYVTGNFHDVGGNPNIDFIAFWDGETWNSLGTGVDYSIPGLTVMGNDLYVAGAFSNAGGVPNTAMIARWDGSNWHALGSVETGFAYDFTYISDIAVYGTDLYVVGLFSNMGGVQNADRVAKWDGEQWHGFGEGIEYGWLWSDCLSVAVSENDVFVSGAFTDAGGNPDADYLVRWDGSVWSGISTELSDSAAHILLVRENLLYCRRPGNKIDRWNILTQKWSSYMTIPERSTVYLDASDIYLFGSFDEINGEPFRNIARWGGTIDCSTTGVRDKTWTSLLELHVYPNPSQDIINYSIGDADAPQMHVLTVTDATGQVVIAKETDAQNVNIADLTAGVYFLQVRSESGNGVGKIVKQ